ncbi:MAG: phosphoribosylamine--glycine ligase [Deltaproteobacteria bacterium]|nr:phosphoribosylamine--glycine ligase [Deltaproteobacteria bacterium]MBF0525455.1 phosphoribosylamine--glycine ligase [Deltaproteobacteria bacterium]
MKILVVGGGGREHALVHALAGSQRMPKIYAAPGNPGMDGRAECVPIKADDVTGLLQFALEQKIDLTIVGPEAPLTMGIVDLFTAHGLKIFGPSQQAAALEGSKILAKEMMVKCSVPTAGYRDFSDYQSALDYLKTQPLPVVVKADGLAAGKGVFVAATFDQAAAALDAVMVQREFGSAGDRVLIEDCLKGEEVSFLVFSDGEHILPMPTSQDHKAVFDGDRGPNTGGMGAYSPAPLVDEAMEQRIMDEIMRPIIQGMAAAGTPYKGVLYAGLMFQDGQPYVLEFNVRFGDPEAQPLLIRLKSDLVDILLACSDGTLDRVAVEWDRRAAVCVVMASKGYPGAYDKGHPIEGLRNATQQRANVFVYHAGTAMKDNQVVTNGGRVLGVTALNSSIADAVEDAYNVVHKISWPGCYFRSDIGQKAIIKTKTSPKVAIYMGSESDLKLLKPAMEIFQRFGIPYEITVASAHRTPERVTELASTARKRGLEVIIAAAGGAAHLAGVIAAQTDLPVIGIPIDSSPLKGLDALLSTVQMPPGVPVATVSVGSWGAANAALLAVRIMAVKTPNYYRWLNNYRLEQALKIEEAAARLAE